jgi:hypothetical protein
MPLRLSIKAGSMAVLEAFLNNKIEGVTITHEAKESAKKELPKPKRTMAFDSAEEILQFIVTASESIEFGLLASWLYENSRKPSKHITYINGYEIPKDQEEAVRLIMSLLKKRQEQNESNDAN